MIKLKYVGVKQDGETAFAAETKIACWKAGDSHEIDDVLAGRMLKHPDVFAVDESRAAKAPAPAARQTPAATPAASAAPAPAAGAALTLAPGAAVAAPATDLLAGMDDAAVKAFVKAQGLKIKGYALFKGDNLRAKVREALAAIPAPAAK